MLIIFELLTNFSVPYKIGVLLMAVAILIAKVRLGMVFIQNHLQIGLDLRKMVKMRSACGQMSDFLQMNR